MRGYPVDKPWTDTDTDREETFHPQPPAHTKNLPSAWTPVALPTYPISHLKNFPVLPKICERGHTRIVCRRRGEGSPSRSGPGESMLGLVLGAGPGAGFHLAQPVGCTQAPTHRARGWCQPIASVDKARGFPDSEVRTMSAIFTCYSAQQAKHEALSN